MRTMLFFTVALLAVSPTLARPALGWTHTDNVAYVAALYADLTHRNATNQEIGVFVNSLESGTSRADIVRKMMMSSEARRYEVSALYERYLRRPTTALESGGSATLQQTAESILSSPEYFKLKGGTSALFIKGLYLDVLGRLPLPSDEVLIQFEHGDTRRPYVVGAVFNGVDSKRRLTDSYCQLYLRHPCGTAATGTGGTLDDIIVAILSSDAYGSLHRGLTLRSRAIERIPLVSPSPSAIPPPR